MAEPPSAGQTYHGSLTGVQRAAQSGGDGGGAPVGGPRSIVDALRPSGHQAGPRYEPPPFSSGATAPAALPGSLRGFEPAGQLVAPWTPGAQLGLDGRAYAPRAVDQLHREEPAAVEASRGAGAEPLPSEASPYLGPQHGLFVARPQARSSRKRNPWKLKRLLSELLTTPEPGEDPEEAGARFKLRICKCGVTRLGPVQTGVRSESGSWDMRGVVTCGQWQCPRCAPRRAREATAILGAAIAAQLVRDAAHDVWMLSMTIPHTAEESMTSKVARLYKAAAGFFDSRGWKRWAKRHGIRAVVRFFDDTMGGRNGLHPHFHVALFPEHAYSGATPIRGLDKETRGAVLASWCAELVATWETWVQKAGPAEWPVEESRQLAFRERGLELTGAESAAAYFAKWGLAEELALSPIKSRNHFDVLQVALDGDDMAGAQYIEFYKATKGRAFVVGMEKMRKALGVTDELVAAHVQREKERRERVEGPAPTVNPLAVTIRPWLYGESLRVGHWRTFEVADQADAAGADAAGVQRAVDEFLLGLLRKRRAARAGPPADSRSLSAGST